jgi:hypothetical protein
MSSSRRSGHSRRNSLGNGSIVSTPPNARNDLHVQQRQNDSMSSRSWRGRRTIVDEQQQQHQKPHRSSSRSRSPSPMQRQHIHRQDSNSSSSSGRRRSVSPQNPLLRMQQPQGQAHTHAQLQQQSAVTAPAAPQVVAQPQMQTQVAVFSPPQFRSSSSTASTMPTATFASVAASLAPQQAARTSLQQQPTSGSAPTMVLPATGQQQQQPILDAAAIQEKKTEISNIIREAARQACEDHLVQLLTGNTPLPLHLLTLLDPSGASAASQSAAAPTSLLRQGTSAAIGTGRRSGNGSGLVIRSSAAQHAAASLLSGPPVVDIPIEPDL